MPTAAGDTLTRGWGVRTGVDALELLRGVPHGRITHPRVIALAQALEALPGHRDLLRRHDTSHRGHRVVVMRWAEARRAVYSALRCAAQGVAKKFERVDHSVELVA